MARKLMIDHQKDFSGGLDLSPDSPYSDKRQFARADNARLASDGVLVIRDGMREVALVDPVDGGDATAGLYWRVTGQQYLMAGKTLWRGTGNFGDAWTNLGGVQGAGLFPGGGSMVAFRDAAGEALYIATGVPGAALRKYTVGGGITTLTSPVNPYLGMRILCTHNLRLFAASPSGIGDTPASVLHYSALENGDTVGNAGAGGGSVVVRSFNATEITALASVGPSLLIFFRRGIFRFTGWSQDDISIDDGITGLSATVGCVNHASVVVQDNTAFFLSEEGFFACGSSGNPIEIGAPINPILRQYEGKIRAVAAGYPAYRLIVWQVYSESGSTYLGTFVYHLDTRGWTQWTGAFGSNAITCLWDGGIGLFAGTKSGDTYVLRTQRDVYRDRLSTTNTPTGRTLDYQFIVQSRPLLQTDTLTEVAPRFLYASGEIAGGVPTAQLGYRLDGGSWIEQSVGGVMPARAQGAGRLRRGLDLRYTLTQPGTYDAKVQLRSLGAEGFPMTRRF
jgi:hypothetical protein